MVLKGRTLLLLLIVASAALGLRPGWEPGNKKDFKSMAKKLMKRCQEKGYQEPEMTLLKTVFNYSDLPMEGRKPGQSNPFILNFLNVMRPGSPGKESPNQGDKMSNKMWNSSNLSNMIKHIRNSSDPSACYLQAFLAPPSWATWNTPGEKDMDPEDYESLVWASRPVVVDMPSTTMNLPTRVPGRNMKKLMEMLQEEYGPMSEEQRTKVAKWAKEQITENYFNCTTRPSSDSRSKLMERCKPSVKWLNSEALAMMGPYLSGLAPDDVDSSPKEKLCEFFSSAKFRTALKMGARMKPSLGKKFLKTFQECFSGKDFDENVDKLGALACHYNAAPKLTPELGRKLLPELDNCDNPNTKKLKKQLIKYVMANSNVSQVLSKLGRSITLLSPKQLSEIPVDDLTKALKNLGPAGVKWTRGQLRALVKKRLGKRKCKAMSREELMALGSIAEGLPRCVLRRVKAQGLLNDTAGLKVISKNMRKGQLMAMLQGLREDVDPSQLVQMLPAPLLRRVSLRNLAKANITSLDQMKDRMWTRAQAAFLAKKMYNEKKLKLRQLRSVLQGITCKMIEKEADTQDMVQAMTETPQWLSKVQAGCAARKLFGTLEKTRADYFETITEEELDDIPTALLLNLPPSKVKDLPDSVCEGFLDKMEELMDLSSLPRRSPSRPALLKKALQCLVNGTDLSGLTPEDVPSLGPLLCELQPSQVRLAAPDVLKSTLMAMSSCPHIPPRHRADLVLLLKEAYGNPSDWSAETLEALGPLLLLDDGDTSALPNKPWMKDVLYFLKKRMPYASAALKRKLFDLTTTATSAGPNAARKKREVDVNPTVELIEELEMNNVFWTPAQLEQMSDETFLATVETLGDVPDYSAEQLAVLSQKATKAFGPVSQMNESAVMQMGCIIQGFSDEDLKKLPLSLDTLEEIAHCGWKDSQMKPVWMAVAKYNNLTAQQLEATDMVALNRIICGLDPDEISQLDVEAFKDAVGSMDGIQCYEVAQQLKSLAVSAFGEPSTLTEAEVFDLGNIIAGLDAAELASLDPSVLSFVRQSCISLIPPENFASMSVAQLEALGPDNAAAVTSAQRAALGPDKLAGLERATTGSRDQKQTDPVPQESGAPCLSIEGIAAFTKPLVVLLTGFLLL